MDTEEQRASVLSDKGDQEVREEAKATGALILKPAKPVKDLIEDLLILAITEFVIL